MRSQVLDMARVPAPLSRNEFYFKPNYEVVAKVPSVASEEDLALERSMYSATPEFAIQHGGPIIRSILEKVPSWYYAKAKELGLYPNIDVRVHDLSLEHIPEGYDVYPSIPGWHADGELRETYFAQPDLSKVPVSFHIIATVSIHPKGVSNTQFLRTPIKMTVNQDLPDSALWSAVHQFVEGMGSREVINMRDGDIIMFDARSLHRAMPTVRSGSRFFFRMSMWHKPNLGEGQLSKQEQLYLLPKPGFQPSTAIPTYNASLRSSIVGQVQATQKISDLAGEQSAFGVSPDALPSIGGPITNQLYASLPPEIIQNARQRGLTPLVDVLIYRLYPGYRPFFPDYDGHPKSVHWHTGSTASETPEVWISVSSLENQVGSTQFADVTTLRDGQILLTSSSLPRREVPVSVRGWRLLMRVRFVPARSPAPNRMIRQQYVDPRSEDTGW